MIAGALRNIMFMSVKGNSTLRVQIITSIHFIPPILNPKKRNNNLPFPQVSNPHISDARIFCLIDIKCGCFWERLIMGHNLFHQIFMVCDMTIWLYCNIIIPLFQKNFWKWIILPGIIWEVTFATEEFYLLILRLLRFCVNVKIVGI